MKIEDYSNIIEKLSNPDTAAEGLVDLNTQLGVDAKAYEDLQKSNDTLRDSNSKLALRITGVTIPPETPPDPEPDYISIYSKSVTEKIGGVVNFA